MAIPQQGASSKQPAGPVGQRVNAPLRPVQARSQATRDALLASGRRLLAERDFDAIAIADIAGGAGMSVGSFYGRFVDKETFFDELQAQVTHGWRLQLKQLLDSFERTPPLAPRMVTRACALAVQLMRGDSGFLRSAMKHANTHPTSWSPIQQVGQEMVDALVVILVPRLTHLRADQREARLRFALQVMFGTCLNGVLHDPAPLHLNNPRLERELARLMNLYLGLAPEPAAAAATRPTSKRSPCSP